MESLVSIVIPTHNSETSVLDTLESVRDQTHRDWECVIVDDGSQDKTVEIVRLFIQSDPRFKLETFQKNKGPSAARNFAIEKSKGRCIAFLDSDDLWHPEKLERQLAFMKEKNAAFTFTAYKFSSPSGVRQQFFNVPAEVAYKDILKSCPISCSTIIYDTKMLGKVYMPSILKRQDYGLCLRLLKLTPKAFGLDEFLSEILIRPGSVSFQKWKAAQYQWQVYRDVENLSLLSSLYNFSHYAYRGVRKYGLSRLVSKPGK